MGKIITGMSVSLDGYIAGPNDGLEHPLGEGGERIFTWMGVGPERNRVDQWLCPPDASLPVIEGWKTECGAIMSGRRTFDIAGGWADGHPIDAPIVVVTHQPPTDGLWSPRLEFATTLEAGLERAQALAGDKDVSVGGASLGQQLLAKGLLDEIELSVASCLLGGGVSMFDAIGPVDLEQLWVIPSEGVTHLRYAVRRS